MRALAFAALALLATPALAAEDHVVVHGLSNHVTDTDRNGRPWNERNFGLGYRRAYSDALSIQTGAYYNSQRRTSVYALVDYTPIGVGPLRVGATAGVATGYTIAPIVPVASLVARASVDRFAVTVRYLPPVVPKFTGVTAVEASWRL